jgi:protein O-mannosyl-transferase
MARPGPSPALAAALLLGAAFALYWTTLRNPLVFDDQYLTPHTLSTYYAASVRHLQLRWLSDATFGWVHAVFGDNMVWQRVLNVAVHGATAATLFGFLARLFETVVPERPYRWVAFFGAAWFLVHPVAVYGVAYLVERSILLATFFSLLSLRFLLEGLVRGRRRFDIAAAVAYLLAISSKEHAIMVPALGVALAMLLKRPSLDTARRMALPLALFAAAALLVLLPTRHLIGAVYEPLADQVVPGARTRADFSLAYPLSIVNQATLFFRYLFTWLVPWPGWMSVDLRVGFPRELWSAPSIAGALAWLAYGVGAAWLLLKRGRMGLAGLGLLFPWLLALTELATVRVQEPYVLYRSYLWMSGFPAVIPAVFGSLAPRWRYAVLAVVVGVLVVPAAERMSTFSSPFRLWDDAARKSTSPTATYAERPFINRGLLSFDAGRMEAARADFEHALRLNERSAEAHVAMGSLQMQQAQFPQALAEFERAAQLDPTYAPAFDKRCMAKTQLRGPQTGLPDCEHAVEVDPGNYDAWTNLGAVYRALGRRSDAAASFERAIDLLPTHAAAHFNYGVLLLESGRRDELVRRHIVIGCQGGIEQACALLKASR